MESDDARSSSECESDDDTHFRRKRCVEETQEVPQPPAQTPTQPAKRRAETLAEPSEETDQRMARELALRRKLRDSMLSSPKKKRRMNEPAADPPLYDTAPAPGPGRSMHQAEKTTIIIRGVKGVTHHEVGMR